AAGELEQERHGADATEDHAAAQRKRRFLDERRRAVDDRLDRAVELVCDAGARERGLADRRWQHGHRREDAAPPPRDDACRRRAATMPAVAAPTPAATGITGNQATAPAMTAA